MSTSAALSGGPDFYNSFRASKNQIFAVALKVLFDTDAELYPQRLFRAAQALVLVFARLQLLLCITGFELFYTPSGFDGGYGADVFFRVVLVHPAATAALRLRYLWCFVAGVAGVLAALAAAVALEVRFEDYPAFARLARPVAVLLPGVTLVPGLGAALAVLACPAGATPWALPALGQPCPAAVGDAAWVAALVFAAAFVLICFGLAALGGDYRRASPNALAQTWGRSEALVVLVQTALLCKMFLLPADAAAHAAVQTAAAAALFAAFFWWQPYHRAPLNFAHCAVAAGAVPLGLACLAGPLVARRLDVAHWAVALAAFAPPAALLGALACRQRLQGVVARLLDGFPSFKRPTDVDVALRAILYQAHAAADRLPRASWRRLFTVRVHAEGLQAAALEGEGADTLDFALQRALAEHGKQPAVLVAAAGLALDAGNAALCANHLRKLRPARGGGRLLAPDVQFGAFAVDAMRKLLLKERGEDTADVHALLEYARAFEGRVARATAFFWSYLLEGEVEVEALPDIVAHIERSKERVERAYTLLAKQFGGHGGVFRRWAAFVQDVQQDYERAADLFLRADEADEAAAARRALAMEGAVANPYGRAELARLRRTERNMSGRSVRTLPRTSLASTLPSGGIAGIAGAGLRPPPSFPPGAGAPGEARDVRAGSWISAGADSAGPVAHLISLGSVAPDPRPAALNLTPASPTAHALPTPGEPPGLASKEASPRGAAAAGLGSIVPRAPDGGEGPEAEDDAQTSATSAPDRPPPAPLGAPPPDGHSQHSGGPADDTARRRLHKEQLTRGRMRSMRLLTTAIAATMALTLIAGSALFGAAVPYAYGLLDDGRPPADPLAGTGAGGGELQAAGLLWQVAVRAAAAARALQAPALAGPAPEAAREELARSAAALTALADDLYWSRGDQWPALRAVWEEPSVRLALYDAERASGPWTTATVSLADAVGRLARRAAEVAAMGAPQLAAAAASPAFRFVVENAAGPIAEAADGLVAAYAGEAEREAERHRTLSYGIFFALYGAWLLAVFGLQLPVARFLFRERASVMSLFLEIPRTSLRDIRDEAEARAAAAAAARAEPRTAGGRLDGRRRSDDASGTEGTEATPLPPAVEGHRRFSAVRFDGRKPGREEEEAREREARQREARERDVTNFVQRVRRRRPLERLIARIVLASLLSAVLPLAIFGVSVVLTNWAPGATARLAAAHRLGALAPHAAYALQEHVLNATAAAAAPAPAVAARAAALVARWGDESAALLGSTRRAAWEGAYRYNGERPAELAASASEFGAAGAGLLALAPPFVSLSAPHLATVLAAARLPASAGTAAAAAPACLAGRLAAMQRAEEEEVRAGASRASGALTLAFALFVPLLLLDALLLLRPAIAAMRSEHERTMAMMLMIPAEVIEEVPALREFVTTGEARDVKQMLADTREQTKSILQAAVDAVIVVDDQGFVQVFNRAAELLLGYSRDEAVGMPITALLPTFRFAGPAKGPGPGAGAGPPEERGPGKGPEGLRNRKKSAVGEAKLAAMAVPSVPTNAKRGRGGRLESVMETSVLELTARRKDGAVFPATMSLGTGISAGRPFSVMFIRDTTEKKRQEEELERERQRSEALLKSMLPEPIVERLKRGEGVIADLIDDATILFSDLVSFTTMAAGMLPEEVVSLLSDVFVRCDELVDSYGLEKIKTIGDAYMVFTTQPPEVVVDFALDMVEAMRALGLERGLNLQLRVGINTGSLIAGVIGTTRLAYDVWGDSVNLASRMESTGLPGRVNLSPSTYDRVKYKYELEERPNVQVKGKGAMSTYLVRSRRARGNLQAALRESASRASRSLRGISSRRMEPPAEPEPEPEAAGPGSPPDRERARERRASSGSPAGSFKARSSGLRELVSRTSAAAGQPPSPPPLSPRRAASGLLAAAAAQPPVTYTPVAPADFPPAAL